MDRAAEFPLQGRELWSARHNHRRNSQGNLFGCLLGFCLLAVLMLSLTVFYLLSRHLREAQVFQAEGRDAVMPGFQKQIGTPPATEMKPRAHLTVSSEKSECVPGKYQTLKWNNNSALLLVKIKYENGFLVISEPGDYFVYAQVTFRNQSASKDNCNTDTKVRAVTQIISKVESGYPVPTELLRGSHFVGERPNWNHAIYLGGVVSLEENDKLSVDVSNAMLVYSKACATFFGAFLI